MPQCTTWHQHVKYKGIVFIEKDGNAIDDANGQEDETLEISRVEDQVNQTAQDTTK